MLVDHVTVTPSQNQNQSPNRNYEECNVDMIHNQVFWHPVHKCVYNHQHLKGSKLKINKIEGTPILKLAMVRSINHTKKGFSPQKK